MLHQVVAHFLRARFPTLLILNKADLPSAATHIAALRAAAPHEAMIPVSARAEYELCRFRRAGMIAYSDSSASASLLPKADAAAADTLARITKDVLGPMHGTGVLSAVTQAVSLCAPLVAYPVENVATAVSVRVQGQYRGRLGSRVACEPVVMYPGSTPEALYRVLSHPPYQAVAGDFVRAEAWSPSSGRCLLRKEDPLPPNALVCIMTNRRVAWQQQLQQQHSSSSNTKIFEPNLLIN
jgi:hypothetical protein